MRLGRLKPSAPRARADTPVFVAFLALLAWLPWPWGSHPPWASSLLVLAAALLVLVRITSSLRGTVEDPSLPRAARIALALWLAWIGWITLQLVPLPSAWLARWKPLVAAVHAPVAQLEGGHAFASGSLLPGATLDQWLLSVGYLCLFWLTLVLVARDRGRQRWLMWTLVLTGLAQALYAIVMTLSGWELGFFGPKEHNIGYATGTFVNKNHLASYLQLTLSAGTALVLADLRPRRLGSWRQAVEALVELGLSPRLRTRVMLAIMVIAMVLTRSRMGNGAFFAGLLSCGSIYVLFRHKRFFIHTLVFFLSVLLIDVWIVSNRYGLEKVAERIQQTDLSTEGRLLVWEDVRPVVAAYAPTGAGLGTFAAAYAPYRSPEVTVYYDHAHNDHLELLIEAGWVGYLLLAALGLLTLAHGLATVARRHDPLACAIGFVGPMALVCQAVHATVEFNLHIPAIAGTLVVLLALSLSCSSQSRRVAATGAPET